MLKIRLSFLIVSAMIVAATATPSDAGGLIHGLPSDGSYVVFRAKSEFDFNGNLQSFERELRLASVGKQEVNGEPGRWIEISTEFAGRKVLAKLLIAEKYLKSDQDPIAHIAKAWTRDREGATVELTDSRLRQLLVFVIGVPHFEKPAKKASEKLKTELGEYECARQSGSAEVDGPMDSKVKIDGELWLNEKVPFGLVKATVKGSLGEIGSIETAMEAVKSGTDAKSELPDAN